MSDEIIDLCDSDEEEIDCSRGKKARGVTTDQNYTHTATPTTNTCRTLSSRRMNASTKDRQSSSVSNIQPKYSFKPSISASKTGTLIDLPRNSDSDSDSGEEYFNRVVLPPPFKSMQKHSRKNHHTYRIDGDSKSKKSLEASSKADNQKQTNSVSLISVATDPVGVRVGTDISSSTSSSGMKPKPNGNSAAKTESKSSSKGQEEIILLSSDDDNVDDDNVDDVDDEDVDDEDVDVDDEDVDDEDVEKETESKISQQKKNATVDSDDDSIFNSPVLFSSKKRSIPSSCEKVNQTCPKRGSRSNINSSLDLNVLLSPLPSARPPPISTNVASAVSMPNSSLTPSKQVPTPSIPQIDVTKIGGKLYPDHRHEFIKALLAHARRIRNVKYQKSGLDSCVQAIVNLSLYQFPVRTAHAASSINGVGDAYVEILTDAEEKCNGNPYTPPQNTFSAVAPAALVSLLEFENQCVGTEALCPMEELLALVNRKVHNQQKRNSPIFPKDIPYYLDKNNFDPSWMQVSKLRYDHIVQMRSLMTIHSDSFNLDTETL